MTDAAGIETPQGRGIIGNRWLYVLVAVALTLIAGVFIYRGIVLKEEISEFELTPVSADEAGVTPDTAFILTSTADLHPAVIEKHLRFAPEARFTVKRSGEAPGVFEVAPEEPLSVDTVYSVTIPEGPLAARDYGWAYQVKAPFQLVSSIPGDKANEVPTNTGIELTFNRDGAINPDASFEINPVVPGRFSVSGETVR
ncbi:MAG: Ig-like domain-containing protein, partial [Patescibacteria group bacterium]